MNMMENQESRKIIDAEITKSKNMFGPLPEVIAKFDDGKEESIFQFYPDEISFTKSEFIGLTEKQARELKFKKDKIYLQT